MTSTGIVKPVRMIGSGGGGSGEVSDQEKDCPGGCGQSVANCTCGK